MGGVGRTLGAPRGGRSRATARYALPRRRPRGLPGRAALWVLLAGLLAAGLGLAALRVDLIRVRYALADALREEAALRAARAELLVEVRRLRDPARLAALAQRAGLSRPERLIELEERP